jgi:thiamine biosynthesis protein ThiS
MELIINGEVRAFKKSLSVEEILKLLSIRSTRVAVELNLEIVGRKEYKKTYPAQGDRLEIVEFVGGG